jgi:hypothetical protein
MRKQSHGNLPLPVVRALRNLGADIHDARRRRRIPTALLAERALISRTTLGKVEKGDPGASVGAFATVLFVLGMIDRLGFLADPMQDKVGVALEDERLPKRVRLPKGAQKKANE